MKWQKLGQIFCADHHYDWMISHAANPVAELIEGDIFRVYFSCRDKNNRSSITFLELDINHPHKILKISDRPLVSPGKLGTFSDSGVAMGCLANVENNKYLYYLGWNLGVTVPWRNSIGLSVTSLEYPNFKQYSEAPIVDRHHVDPYSISYPWVMFDDGIWKMWYGSNLSWGTKDSDMLHVIKYAESTDAIHWRREGLIALNLKSNAEYALSKPCVLKENGIYKMWYSYRGSAYRIGYAESTDGLNWIRKDEEVGIDVSDFGWDSEMIEYAFVFNHAGQKYMLYNGNGYGKTGFGLAILESE